MASIKSRKVAVVSVLVFEAVLVVLFSIFVKYDAGADPLAPPAQQNNTAMDSQYPMFQDIHVMVFIGFGFLMTFLRKYAFSSLGFTFLISSLVMQWGLLCQGFFRLNPLDERIHLSITSLINADIVAAAVLISLGAVLGKVSPIQIFIMAIFETVFFAVNEYVGTEVFEAVDAGGSIYVHTFGAYFGLTVSFVLAHGVAVETEGNKLESSTYQSDITAMIGSLFLWIFWPSFNAGLLSGDAKHRAVLNTYLSLAACCMTAFATSSVVNKNTKFDMVHIQNATLAGGVCVGTAANMMIQPWGALVIGSFAGVLSVLGFRFVQGWLLKKLHIHDTCGVNNLHGMPGIVAGVIGAIMAGLADQNNYGARLFEVFPAMGPSVNRTSAQQAGYQIVGLLLTLVIAIIGGLVTGALVRKMVAEVPPGAYHDDRLWWDLEQDEREETKEQHYT